MLKQRFGVMVYQGPPQKNYLNHIKSIKHKKNENLSIKKDIIERANEEGI